MLLMKILAKILILFVVIISSCGKDKVSENSGSADQVPNSSGDYWKYKISSLEGEQKGFLEVRIINENTYKDRRITTWVFSYPEVTDTVYKVLTDSSFNEYSNYPTVQSESYPFMRYVLPMEPGMKWCIGTTSASDSIKVVKYTTLIVPAGEFTHTLQLDLIASHYLINYANGSQYWFTPHFGITRMKIARYTLGVGDQNNGIYELEEYRLK
jgi:hypothetical protein